MATDPRKMKSRRSWLIVPAHDAAAIEGHASFAADVTVLDLEYTVPVLVRYDEPVLAAHRFDVLEQGFAFHQATQSF